MIDVAEAVREMTEGPGFLVVPDAFNPGPVLRDVDKLVDEHVAAGRPMVDGGYRPDVLLVASVQELMLKPWLLELGEVLLGCKPGFGSLTPNFVPAGSPGMVAHVDSPYAQMTDEELAEPRPCLCLQMIWYLCDVTEDRGPTAVVAGSYRRGRRPDPAQFAVEAEPVLAKAGSLFLSHGALWHSTMPNRSSEPRPAIISKYFPAWCRLPWNGFCRIPPELLPGMVDLIYPDYRAATGLL